MAGYGSYTPSRGRTKVNTVLGMTRRAPHIGQDEMETRAETRCSYDRSSDRIIVVICIGMDSRGSPKSQRGFGKERARRMRKFSLTKCFKKAGFYGKRGHCLICTWSSVLKVQNKLQKGSAVRRYGGAAHQTLLSHVSWLVDVCGGIG
jgi:hypothetical protein